MKCIYLIVVFCLLAFINLEADPVDLSKFKVYENYSVHTPLSWSRSSEAFRVHEVTLEEALQIAENSPEITHFFYVNHAFVEGTQGFDYATDTIFFEAGDAVFFTGEQIMFRKLKKSNDSYADTYVKKKSM